MKIRKANTDDCQTYFDWANDPVVRANSISMDPIPWESHVKWFTNRLQSSDSFLYICEQEGIPAGQVRFDCKENKYVINYLIGADFRGKGLSEKLLRYAIEALKVEVEKTVSLYALVKKGNLASSKSFHRNNFDFNGFTTLPNDATEYEVYTKNEIENLEL